MEYTAVIFDLDGVICRTDRYHYQAWKALADSLHIPFDEQVNNSLRGISRMDSLRIILQNGNVTCPPQEMERLAERKNRLYRELLQGMTPADLSGEVSDTLQYLRGRGIRLAIGSSSKNTALILRRIGLSDFFDAVADGTQITRAKPDPEVFTLAARLLGVSPPQALVVEDAEAGIEAAHRGGFSAAGLGEAARTADYPLETFSELKRLFAAE